MSSSTLLNSDDLEVLLDEVIRDLERLSVHDVSGVGCVRAVNDALLTPPPSPTSAEVKGCDGNVVVSRFEGDEDDGGGEGENERKSLERIPVRTSGAVEE